MLYYHYDCIKTGRTAHLEKMCSPGCIKDWRINIMTEKKNNFEGEEFLEEVLQKLNIRLREIEKDLA